MPCNNYYERLSEDNIMSNNKTDNDMYDEEKYNKFDDEVKPEETYLLSPRTIKDAPWIHQWTHRI